MTPEQLKQTQYDLHTARSGLHAAALLLADIAASMAEMLKAEAKVKPRKPKRARMLEKSKKSA
jgi:negative regulator of sigma E activity